ncbi:hypothetical protein [Effusibacillus consociatus]|uniref:Uncharacterized protein n=1 Tax=Effusibacillus consociatus TaxID=1117041 RepID=A0ABV9PZ79_9BACL
MKYQDVRQALEYLSEDQLAKVHAYVQELNKDKTVAYSVQGYKLQLQRKNQRKIHVQ